MIVSLVRPPRVALPMWARVACCLVVAGSASAQGASAQGRPNVVQSVAADTRPVLMPSLESALQRPVTVRVERVSLRQALTALATSAGVRIQYLGSDVDAVTKPVTIAVSNVPLGVALERGLSGTTLQAVAASAEVLVIRPDPAKRVAQAALRGKVLNAKTRQPVASATILLDDATAGVTSGSDGAFHIAASVGTHTLNVRALGFTHQRRKIVVSEEMTGVEILLEPATSVLDEVVVTGTVVATERKAIPNPITVITAEELQKRGITRMEQLFRGEIPGVVALEQGTMIYEANLGNAVTSKVYSRGASTLSGGTTPLKTYIDGVELLDPSYLGTIDPASIERIEIITGPQAATVYGSGAMGGVMQIFTKKGSGTSHVSATFSAKYGMLESNLSKGKAPTHNDVLSVTGGSGPEFSYSGNLSYNYVGPWQPYMFSRVFGASAGLTHARGPVTLTGSVSMTTGRNGTFTGGTSPVDLAREQAGDWRPDHSGINAPTQMVGSSSNQTFSLNADYRAFAAWQHHVTVGRSQNTFGLSSTRAAFELPYDSLYKQNTSRGERTTLGYNMTFAPAPLGRVSTTLTLGANGSWGDQLYVSGCTASASASGFVGCYAGGAPSVSSQLDSKSWGGFGRWQVGLFERLYLTLGLRGERNPSYGRARRIDWTPSNGVTYTLEAGELTIKLLGSYGRATRPPLPDQRREIMQTAAEYDPPRYISQFANADLTPEYSRGPQGGIELYYGNLGSLTINRYKQQVTDLIQSIPVDTIFRTYLPSGTVYSTYQYQYVNAAKVRQHGWEATAGLNLGPVTVKGTYSWTDSRVVSANSAAYSTYRPGQSFIGVPSHTGNVIASYAHGGTSMTLTTNYMGKILQNGYNGAFGEFMSYTAYASRLGMYIDRRRSSSDTQWSEPAYAKSDLAVSQRVSTSVSLTLNVINIGNSYGFEGVFYEPALGRQSSFGVSVRLP